MAVNLFNSGSTTSAAAGNANVTANTATEASDMFTKLLVAQIQNQDPLSPTDPSQFVQQLTQLSQTESMQKLSSLTSANSSILQSMQVLSLGAQVGSDVMAETRSVRIAGTAPIKGQVTLEASSADTNLVLTAADGTTTTIKLGVQAPGAVAFTIDPVKLGLPEGSYGMAVTTSTKETPAIDIGGRLNSVRLSPTGGVVLSVANLGEIDPGAVTAFNGKSASATQ